VPPGVVALPDRSAEPAVGAPWLLASLGLPVDLPVVVELPFCMALEPPPVVLPFIESPVVVLLAAGLPDAELPPAAVPLLCASASDEVSAKADAKAMVVIFMGGFLSGFVND
jgi:hypothetical protein